MSNIGHNEIPSNPEDLKKVRIALEEISNSMTRISGERDFIKEAKKKLKEEYGMKPKMITRLAKTMFNDDFDSTTMDHEAFVTAWNSVKNAR